MKNAKHIIKIIAFILVFSVAFCGLSIFVQPIWRDWNHYDTIHGFYEQPQNTIETVFLGGSIVINAITPMELYGDYGICAYNLATEQQPVYVSYYWLQEAYRLHSESLKTVVFDTSMMVRDSDKSFYRKAISPMKFSPVKFHAVKGYSNDINERLTYLIPLLEYHSRWSELEKNDFNKEKSEIYSYTRGYNLSTYELIDLNAYDKMKVPTCYIDEFESRQQMNEEALYYFEKIISFCEDNGIKLVMIEAPRFAWSVTAHNSVQEIADNNNLNFIDFNYEPYANEIAFNYATDSADGDHMNYYGATKITKWLGKYLLTECNATDVRGDEKYAFLEEELKQYHENITDVILLMDTDNVADYLTNALQLKNCIVFLSVKDDAAKQLTQEHRAVLANLGLTKLSELTYGDSYLAVIEEGTIIEEQSEFWDEEAYEAGNTVGSGKYISTVGATKNQNKYTIRSGGARLGNEASCMIDGAEYFEDSQGINVLVYNYRKEAPVDYAVFNTAVSSIREVVNEAALDTALQQGMKYTDLPERLKNLYLYERRTDNYKTAAWLDRNIEADGMWDFINAYWGKKDYVIFLSVKDDAADLLNVQTREAFAQMGLKELSKLEKEDSYIAVVDSGDLLFEQREHENTPISTIGLNYKVMSGGRKSGNVSSITIDEKEYSMAGNGMNIVIFDRQLNTVIDKAIFDISTVSTAISASMGEGEK